jgi:hypothetical protein
MSLADARDIVIVIYGVVGILLFLVLIAVAVASFFAGRKLSRSVQQLLADPIRPTLYEFQQTAQNIRGTSEFVADRTVHPIIRTLAVLRGVRRGVGAFGGLRKRGQ